MSHIFFNECVNKSLRDYLECANIFKGPSPKNKTNLIEMIIYGCITEKLDKKEIEDMSIKQSNQILNKNNTIVKSLPGSGNAGLRKKEIKPFVEEKLFIKVTK